MTGALMIRIGQRDGFDAASRNVSGAWSIQIGDAQSTGNRHRRTAAKRLGPVNGITSLEGRSG